MNNLLAFADMTDPIKWISIVAIILVVVILFVISLTTKKLNTMTIVYAGLSLALSFVLSIIKFSPVTYGGSVTLASFVPIIIFTYSNGFGAGLLIGIIYGLLQFISNPYVLTPITFILDYILAFASIALAGIFKRKSKPNGNGILMGTIVVYAVRFLMAFISGIIYFNLGSIWADLPQNSAVIYSFLYQITYIAPDMIITLIAIIALDKTKVLNRILSHFDKAKQTETVLVQQGDGGDNNSSDNTEN